MMLEAGIYPAAVTPFDESGKLDVSSFARLLAWFEAAGCKGVVLCGTNGEGPALSAGEKRDLVRASAQAKGKLDVIVGAATSSLEEAVWLSRRAEEAGAKAMLVMPPFFYPNLDEDVLVSWFLELMDKSSLPIIIYNFPKRAGSVITAEVVKRVANHERFAGLKDSSSESRNLHDFRSALEGADKGLFIGDETLLYDSLQAGWTGSISGAANILASWLSTAFSEYGTESGAVKFEVLMPILQEIRKASQPATHKAFLVREGIIRSATVRLPLRLAPFPDELIQNIRKRLGNPFAV